LLVVVDNTVIGLPPGGKISNFTEPTPPPGEVNMTSVIEPVCPLGTEPPIPGRDVLAVAKEFASPHQEPFGTLKMLISCPDSVDETLHAGCLVLQANESVTMNGLLGPGKLEKKSGEARVATNGFEDTRWTGTSSMAARKPPCSPSFSRIVPLAPDPCPAATSIFDTSKLWPEEPGGMTQLTLAFLPAATTSVRVFV
jgi:hypothetical protein